MVWLYRFRAFFAIPISKNILVRKIGGTLGGGQNYVQHSAYGEILAFGACALLSLALVQKWGRIFPHWVPFLAEKRVPRWILITGGWIATCMTAPMGLLAMFGSVMQALSLAEGPVSFNDTGLMVSIVYGSWLLLGHCTRWSYLVLSAANKNQVLTVWQIIISITNQC